jgi:UDP-N-acetyl-D-mannosaminuronate dehydrogenase
MTESIYKILNKKTKDIHISDPYLSKDIKINGLKFIETKKIKYLDYGLIAILVKHDYFKNLNINNLLNNNIIIYDFHDFLKIKKTYKF